MATELDHLLFTWSWKGLTDHPGFQPVMATGRFADKRNPVARRGIELCRYVRPPGLEDPAEAPVSFGWTAVGGVRLVFRRSYLGKDPSGRPGNFCAHLLAGPLAELPVAVVAGWVNAPHWWKGEEPEEFLARWNGLPGFPETGSQAVAPRAELSRFAEAMFHSRGRAPVVLRGRPRERVVALAAELTGRLDGVLERVSVSTYEADEGCAEFDVVGIADSGPMPAGAVEVGETARSGHVRRCRELVLSGARADQETLALTAVAVAAERERANLGLFLRYLVVFDQVAAGEQPLRSLVPAVLRSPYAAALLLGMDAGMASVVEALAENHEACWESVTGTVGEVDGPSADRLAERLGVRLGTGSPVTALPATLDRVHAAPPAFRQRCLETFLLKADPDRLIDLDIGRRVRLLTAAPPLAIEDRVAEALLTRPDGVRLSLADHRELAPQWRGRALAAHIEGLPNHSQRMLKEATIRLLDEPALATETARHLGSATAMLAIVGRLKPMDAWEIVKAATAGTSTEHGREILGHLLPRLDVRFRPYLLKEVAEAVPDGFVRGLDDHAVAGIVGDMIVHELPGAHAKRLPGPDLVPLLRRVGGPWCERWCRILEPRGAGGRYTVDDFDRALGAAHPMDQRHRNAAQELAVVLCLRELSSVVEVVNFADLLEKYFMPSTEDIARTLFRTVAGHPGLSFGPALYYVAEKVQRGQLALKKNMSLRDGKLQKAAEEAISVLGLRKDFGDTYDLIDQLGAGSLRWFNAARPAYRR